MLMSQEGINRLTERLKNAQELKETFGIDLQSAYTQLKNAQLEVIIKKEYSGSLTDLNTACFKKVYDSLKQNSDKE